MGLDNLPTKTYPGFALSMLDRAVKEFFALRCNKADLARIREYFTHDGAIHCAYCDSPRPSRWDHVHPVSRGGDTVPGNLVPACGRCDDSKQAREIDDWAASNSRHRPSEAQAKAFSEHIAAYRSTFKYVPRSFQEKLTPEQLESYRDIAAEVLAIRQKLSEAGFAKGRQIAHPTRPPRSG